MATVTTQDPDAELAAALRRGDEEAASALLRAHWAPAYRAALRICGGDAAAAEDVAQDALVKALRAIDDLDPQRSFRPWFYRVVGNTAREHLRRTRRRARHERQAPPLRAAAPGDVLAEREALDALRASLTALPEPSREAVALRYLEGLSLREVAEALECPEGTASSRIRRGLESLRRSLVPALASSAALLALLPQLAQAEPIPAAPAAQALAARAARAPVASPGRRLLPLRLLSLALASAGGLALFLSSGGLGLVGPQGTSALAQASTSPSAARPLAPDALPGPTGARETPSLSPPPQTPPLEGGTSELDAHEGGGPPEEPAKGNEAAPGDPPHAPLPPIPAMRHVDARVVRLPAGVRPTPVWLSAGEDDGVAKGYVFRIYRGAQAVATVTVEDLQRDSCGCSIRTTVPGQSIQLGDDATTAP